MKINKIHGNDRILYLETTEGEYVCSCKLTDNIFEIESQNIKHQGKPITKDMNERLKQAITSYTTNKKFQIVLRKND